MQTIGERFGHRSKPIITLEGEYVTGPVYVGIELEFSNVVHYEHGLLWWSWHSDGSIRGERTGELVLCVPTHPRGLDRALAEYRECVAQHVTINESCGVHVHVDVCDLTFEELRGVLLLYSVLERTLYKYCGGSRENNNFCVPLGECGDRLSWFRGGISINNDLRYCGLNIAAVRKFGSIEFRMHPGCTSPTRIGAWVGICARIKEFGRTCTPESIYNMLYGSSGTFLTETMGRHAGHLLPCVSTNDLVDGAREGKEIYYATNLLGSEKRMISNRSKYKTKALYSPYDVWSQKQRRDTAPPLVESLSEYLASARPYNVVLEDYVGPDHIVPINRSDFEGEF